MPSLLQHVCRPVTSNFHVLSHHMTQMMKTARIDRHDRHYREGDRSLGP